MKRVRCKDGDWDRLKAWLERHRVPCRCRTYQMSSDSTYWRVEVDLDFGGHTKMVVIEFGVFTYDWRRICRRRIARIGKCTATTPDALMAIAFHFGLDGYPAYRNSEPTREFGQTSGSGTAQRQPGN